jgi:hypothetical protein
MITKEELLQKGIDPEKADMIIAALEGQKDDSSPLALLKAEMDGGSEMDTLFKAKGEGKGDGDGDDDDDDADYDEEYMKKYMKKYMKANKKEASNAAKEVGLFAEKMEKAINDIPSDAEGAVVEMADLSEFLDSQALFNEKMAKAVEAIVDRIEIIANQNVENYSLLHKAAAVTAETAEIISGIGNMPQGRKGVVVADMEKAVKTAPVNVDSKVVYSVLMKAVASGDKVAGQIGSKFESAGKRFNLLAPKEQEYVNELIKKEAN